MADYYIATDGSDIAKGSLSAPWKTISRAKQANSGPTIRSW
ncbi:hypothetical protein FHT78_002177 [Rhizobium sp. BK196]|nr:hypothetical protein [Rhizobium sp. BK196]MBB3310434.1 hypothetical protein [Rhizobium sp. BK196]